MTYGHCPKPTPEALRADDARVMREADDDVLRFIDRELARPLPLDPDPLDGEPLPPFTSRRG